MPVTPQLLDEFKKLISNYSTQSKFKVLPSLRADSNLAKTLSRLDGLLTVIIDQGEQLNDQTIIHALTTYAIDKTTSDPIFFSCVQLFLKNYQINTKNVCSIMDPMHLAHIPGADEAHVPEMLLNTIHTQKVNHESEKLAFERQLDTAHRENTQLKTTVETLRKKESELEQLKTTFKRLQEVNRQLHNVGITLLGLDSILTTEPSNDTAATHAEEITTNQEFNIPPPPPPPPMPQISMVARSSSELQTTINEPKTLSSQSKLTENTVRFRPGVTAVPGQRDVMSELRRKFEIKEKLEQLAKESAEMEASSTSSSSSSSLQMIQTNASSLIKSRTRPTPKPRNIIKNNTPTSSQEVLHASATEQLGPQTLHHETTEHIPVQEVQETTAQTTPLIQPNNAAFFKPLITTNAAERAIQSDSLVVQSPSTSTTALKTDTNTNTQQAAQKPNSLARYQAAQQTNASQDFIRAINAVMEMRRPAFEDSDSEDDESWDDSVDINKTVFAAKKTTNINPTPNGQEESTLNEADGWISISLE